MKRRFHRLGAVAMALSFLVAATGCTISADDSGGGSGDGKTLTVWQYYTGPDLKWIKKQAKDFEADNAGVSVKIVQVPGEQQDQKLLASVATGSGPDVFVNNIVVDFPTLVGGGVMKNLTPYWKKYADKDQFPDAAVWKDDGKVYNLMFYTNLIGLFYNKDILGQYGITQPPATLDELTADLAKVTADGKYEGLAESGSPDVEGAWLFMPQLLGQGINYCNLSGPKVTAAFQRLQEWASKGYIPKATATWSQNDAWQKFMTGKFAFAINGNWNLGSAKEAKFGYGTAQFPAPPGGKSIVFPGGEGFGIGANSKNPDLAWKFIESAMLSKQAGLSKFEMAGSIPMRKDVASSKTFTENEMVKPFVAAAQSSAKWPNNPKTADMQNSFGKVVSGVISGQMNAEQAAQKAISGNKKAIDAGGGGCE